MQADTSKKRKKTTNKKRRGNTVLIIVITLMCLAIIGLSAYLYYILNLETFYAGVWVDGISLEGMTRDEAAQHIKQHHQPQLDSIRVILAHEDKQWEYGYEQIHANINIHEVIENAYQIGRSGNIIEKIREIYFVRQEGAFFYTTLTYDIHKLSDQLDEIAKDIYIQPLDAIIEFHPDANEKFTFEKETIGLEMLVDQTVADLAARIGNDDFTVYQIPTKELHPQYTLEEVQTWTSRIASYNTVLSGTSERIYNINLSLESFHGVRLEAGEIFSLNEATGPRNKSTGYKDAPVIIGGEKLEDAPGGGNCQTSTTLYGAAMRADLEILERWPHSWPSSYETDGQDASVNYPSADLKFKNTYDTPVFIRRYISGGRLYVEFYGKAPTKYDYIDIATEWIERGSKPDFEIVKDPNMYEDQEEIEIQSRPLIRTQTYRVYYKDGKEIDRVDEAYSRYPSITGRKRVGTKPRPRPEPPPQNEDTESTAEEASEEE